MLTRFLLPCLTLVFLGSTQSHVRPAQPSMPLDAQITLSEMGCVVRIFSNGVVTVEGRSFDVDISQIKMNIGVDEVQNLISEFGRINFFALQNRFCGRKDGCPKSGACEIYGIVTTSLRLNGKSKTVMRCDSICFDLDGGHHPRELAALEEHIRAAVNLNRRRN